MPISCPKCNIFNPRGAEICGECGWILASSPASPPRGSQPAHTSQSSAGKADLTGASVSSRKEKKKAPFSAQILSGVLWVLSAALIALSIFLVKPGKSITLPIPLLPSNLPYASRMLAALLILAGGIFTLIVAYGISSLKRWGLKAYLSWVMIQVVLEILARVYRLKPGTYLSAVILAELIVIPLLWKMKHRFSA
ncbi:MAG: hypothetical protein AB1611_01350 [bacterium]